MYCLPKSPNFTQHLLWGGSIPDVVLKVSDLSSQGDGRDSGFSYLALRRTARTARAPARDAACISG